MSTTAKKIVTKGFSKPKAIPDQKAIDAFIGAAAVTSGGVGESVVVTEPTQVIGKIVEKEVKTKTKAYTRTYSMTLESMQQIEDLQAKISMAYKGRRMISKSEVLRAGLFALLSMSDDELFSNMEKVEIL